VECSLGQFFLSTLRACTPQVASPLSLLFPLHTKLLSATLLFPLRTQKQGGYPRKNVGAPTFSLSFLPIPPLPFQSLAHSFVFRSTPISCLHSAFRTLSQKTGGLPPLVRPIAFLYSPVRSFFFSLSCRLSTVGCLLLLHSPPIHNPVTAPSPILLPLLSQCSPVRGPTHTPCLSLSERLRYTSTDAIHRARSVHEARTDN